MLFFCPIFIPFVTPQNHTASVLSTQHTYFMFFVQVYRKVLYLVVSFSHKTIAIKLAKLFHKSCDLGDFRLGLYSFGGNC